MATASTVFSGFVDKVAFMNKLPILLKATSDDNNPTPGYMYQEITNISFESNGYCQCLLDYLVDRLEKKSFHVKLKVLRIIKHVVVNGNQMFTLGLRRSAKGIKDATNFTGPPDPLHGNSPYIAVRKAAEELSEILFDTERKGKQSQDSQTSLSAPGIGSSGNLSTTRMEGFGNTVDAPKKTFSESVLENIKDFAENMMDPYALVASKTQDEKLREYQLIEDIDNESSNVSTAPKYTLSSKGEYKAVDVTQTSVPSNPDVQRVQQSGKLSSNYKPGKAGGGWEEERDGSNGRTSNGSEQKSKDSTDLAEKLESVSVTDWSQETQLVEEITSPGGVKPIPSRDALTKFTKRSATLNCVKIVELLNDKLTDPSSQVQLKSLCVLEYLLKADLVSTEDMSSCLKTNLQRLSQGSQGSALTKAKKILRQLESMEKTAVSVPCAIHSQSSNGIFVPDLCTPCTIPLNTHNDDILVPDLSSQEFDASSRSTSSESFVTLATDHTETEAQYMSMPVVPDSTVQISTKLFSGMNLQNSAKTEHVPVNDQCRNLSQSTDFSLLGNTFETAYVDENNRPAKQVNKDAMPVTVEKHSDMHTYKNMKCLSKEDETNRTQNQNPLMSRTANMNDLLTSMGMIDIVESSSSLYKGQKKTSTSSIQSQSQMTTPQPPSVTEARPQNHQILAAYPQLSNAKLSANSTIPVRPQQCQKGSFSFMTSETDKTTKSSDAFNFVQDAMKASKK
ncbi:AP-4 complex accessory subunit tepsin-like [Glandiceps talaboti]